MNLGLNLTAKGPHVASLFACSFQSRWLLSGLTAVAVSFCIKKCTTFTCINSLRPGAILSSSNLNLNQHFWSIAQWFTMVHHVHPCEPPSGPFHGVLATSRNSLGAPSGRSSGCRPYQCPVHTHQWPPSNRSPSIESPGDFWNEGADAAGYWLAGYSVNKCGQHWATNSQRLTSHNSGQPKKNV